MVNVYIHTVWKLQDFSVIQILREINFGESQIQFGNYGKFTLMHFLQKFRESNGFTKEITK